MGYMSAEEAAAQLGVTPTQIRDLYRRGELNGKRRNGVVVIDQESVLARTSGEVSKPLDPQAAWDAALAMEEDVAGLTPARRHQLRRRLTGRSSDYILRALSRRAKGTTRYLADRNAFRAILVHENVIPTGTSVIAPDTNVLEGYVTDLQEVVDEFSLTPSRVGNVVLHVPYDDVTLRLTQGGGIPALIVAADASSSSLAQYRNEGRKTLDELSKNPTWVGKRVTATSHNVTSPHVGGEPVPPYHDPFSSALPPGQTTSLWAKTDYWDKNSHKWGLLVTHLSDAGRIAAQLWDTWLSPSTKRSISTGTTLGEELSRKLCILLAAAHDVGKASPAFERQVSGDDRFSDLVMELENAGMPFDAQYLPSVPQRSLPRHEYVSMFALARALPRGGRGIRHAKFLAAVVGAHHGYFPREDTMVSAVPELGSGNSRSGGDAPTVWTHAQDALVVAAKNLAGITNEEWERISQAKMSPHAITLITGVIVMADWISSNDKYFPLGYPHPPLPSAERTEKAWKGLDLVRNRWEPEDISPANVAEKFRERFRIDADPRPAQLAAVTAASALRNPGIIILEAPTGVGKTEAALLAAESLARKFGCNGVLFALPTRATSNASYTRVNSWLSTQNPRLSAHLTHGKAEFNKEFRSRLDRFTEGGQSSVHDRDDGDDCCGELHTWFNNTRNKHLADFTVGTVDQVLLASAVGKHLSVRHLGLSGKVVVLDEVHASDVYMSSFLVRTLRWLGAMGVPVVALTATLTPSLRRSLHNAYSGISDTYDVLPEPSTHVREQDFPEAEDVSDYPVLTYSSPGDARISVTPVDNHSSRTVKIVHAQCTTAKDAVAHTLPHISESGCSALIFNTVSRAQKAYDELREVVPDTCEVMLLHSRFTGVDRARLERTLLDLTGKDGNRPRHLIVVSTQIIEQSLDVDFDIMYTDIAPVDLIVQRMGRLHRHSTRANRDPKFASPVLHVGGYRVDEKGSLVMDGAFYGWVYSKLFLIRTAKIINGITEIREPQDLSGLMRQMDKGVEMPPEWQDAYDKAWDAHAKDMRDQHADMPRRTVAHPLTADVPWRAAADNSLTYTPVRKGVPNVDVVVVYATDKGLQLPMDGEEGQGWVIGDVMYPELARAIAVRAVPLDAGNSRDIRHTGYGSGKRGRIVPNAVRHDDLVPSWESWAGLRGLGILVFTPDDDSLTSGTAVIEGVAKVPTRDKKTRGETFIEKPFHITYAYSPVEGLRAV